MFYVLYGNDRLKLLKEAENILGKNSEEKPIYFDENLQDASELLSLATTDNLFSEKTAVKCDGVLEREEVAEAILKNLEDFSKSPNIFVFLESSIDVETLKILKKYSDKIENYKLAEKKWGEFNIFQLSDALGMRDKKTLWVLYTKAINAGKTGEEIAGTLFWQLKSMILVSRGEGKSLNPFVANKAKSFLKNYKQEELEKFSLQLIRDYHEAHRGRFELETALERFVLSV